MKYKLFKTIFMIIIIEIIFRLFNSKTIEGNSNEQIKCIGNTDTSIPDISCSSYPLIYKDGVNEINRCPDNSNTCSEIEEKKQCCKNVTSVCQGNLIFTDDIVCDEGSWPKVNSEVIPTQCEGRGNDPEECWMPGKKDLKEMEHEEQQELCCTSRSDFNIAERVWGVPYYINKASKIYSDSKILRDSNNEIAANSLLNEALEQLYEARSLDDPNDPQYDIPRLINLWSTESGFPIGSGMCKGNIDKASDINCSITNKVDIDQPFIEIGSNVQKCCKVTGKCSGNTNSLEDIICPDGYLVKENTFGSTVNECCDEKIRCKGNSSVHLNFKCPPPLIPVLNSEQVIGKTKKKCCRNPDDKEESELIIVSENETISGTLILNSQLYEIAGTKGSEKRVIFENNFKEDIAKLFNKSGKISISSEQIIINEIYNGSIIINFKIIPNNGVSVTKEYFSYILSKKVLLEKLDIETMGGVTDVQITSWQNIEYWPDWIRMVIIFILTIFMSFLLFVRKKED